MMPNIHDKNQITSVRKIINQLQFSSTCTNFDAFALKSHYKEPLHYQILQQKRKKQWIQPGYVNGQFSKTLAVRSRALDNWQIQRMPMATRSYKNPKDFKGIKYDVFSRQFPKDLSNTHSKKFQLHLSELKQKYQKKVHKLTIEDYQKRRQRSIETIKGKGNRFQLSKDKLFGFVNLVKPVKSITLQRGSDKQRLYSNTTSEFYKRV